MHIDQRHTESIESDSEVFSNNWKIQILLLQDPLDDETQ